MPVYKFQCQSCFFYFDHYLSVGERDNNVSCVKCRNKSIRIRTAISHPSVYEIVDKYRGKKNRRDVGSHLRQRSYNNNKQNAGKFIEEHGYKQAKKMTFFDKDGMVKTPFQEH